MFKMKSVVVLVGLLTAGTAFAKDKATEKAADKAVTMGAMEYAIDPSHSEVGFGVKHMMISTVKGRFNKFEGKFNFDEATGKLSDIDVKIDANSIDTNDAKRDEHLKNEDFFDTKNFPTLVFKSEKIEMSGKKPKKAIGTLTIRGKSQKVTLNLDYKGAVTDPMGNQKIGFAATTEINRKDFGVSWNKTLDKGGLAVGEKVTIHIEGEAVKAKKEVAGQ